MAHPIIAATSASATPADSTSHIAALPSGIVSGNLLVAITMCDGVGAMSWPADWIAPANGAGVSGSAIRSECRYRIADGGEAASITITGSSEAWLSRVWRIVGHLGTAPECAAADSTVGPANPPLLIPSWGAKDSLYVFHMAWDGLPTFTYWNVPRAQRLASHTAASGGAAGDIKHASCGVQHLGKSLWLDPGPLTSGAASWRALAIALEPAADVDPLIAARQEHYGVEA